MVKNVDHFMDAKLGQRAVMAFMWSEKTDPVKSYCRPARAFQVDAYAISSVHKWIGTFKTGRISVLDELRAGRPQLDHIDSKILSLFTEDTFHSVRNLAQELGGL
jgi:hypothetical protein